MRVTTRFHYNDVTKKRVKIKNKKEKYLRIKQALHICLAWLLLTSWIVQMARVIGYDANYWLYFNWVCNVYFSRMNGSLTLIQWQIPTAAIPYFHPWTNKNKRRNKKERKKEKKRRGTKYVFHLNELVITWN